MLIIRFHFFQFKIIISKIRLFFVEVICFHKMAYADTHKLTSLCLLAAQSCLTLCDPVDCSPPGSSIHGILQARTLRWAAVSFSRGSFWSRNRIHVFCTGRWVFYCWATREALIIPNISTYWSKQYEVVTVILRSVRSG